MRLRTLELENFRRHRATRVELPDGVTAVLGPNGSGKSTLLEALGFALFGPPATRTGKDLVRFDGAAPSDAVRVRAELELGGEALEVVRELRGKNLTPHASLSVDGTVVVPAGAGSGDAVTHAVERRLGMDREAFFTTVVARQKELARLGDDLGPTERKRLLLRLLGVDALDRAISAARGRRRDAEAAVAALRADLPDAKALAAKEKEAGATLEAAKKEDASRAAAWVRAKARLHQALVARDAAHKAHEARHAAQAEAAEAKRAHEAAARRVQEFAAQVAAGQKARAEAEALRPRAARMDEARAAWQAARDAAQRRTRIAALRKRLAALPVPAHTDGLVAKLTVQVAEAESAARAAGEEAAVLASTRSELEARLATLARLGEEAPCPTCERPLGDHLPALRSGLAGSVGERKERLQAVQARRTTLDKRLATLRKDLEAARQADAAHAAGLLQQERLQADIAQEEADLDPAAPTDSAPLEAALREAEAARQALARAEALAEGLDERQKAVAQAQAEEVAAKRRLAAAEAALVDLPDTAPALAAATAAHENAAAEERDAERAVLAARHAVERAQQALAEAKRRLAEAHARAQRLRAHEEEARYWGALAGGHGHGLLETFRDHLVARIGPAVSAEASRLLALFTHGRYTEVLLDADYDLYVADGGVHYTLDRFSGGESDLVHLALRLAVSRLLLERSGGAELRFLALDEVFGSLDDERRTAVLGALQELGGLYTQVLLVTHQEALRDALDAVLRVEEKDGEAVVTLHSG